MGVDSSTQSCKVEIRDLTTGRLLGAGSAPHPPAFPPCSEQHPSDWVGALVAAVNRAMLAVRTRPDIRAISVAAQCHGLVLLDEPATYYARPSSGTTPRVHPTWRGSSSASAPVTG